MSFWGCAEKRSTVKKEEEERNKIRKIKTTLLFSTQILHCDSVVDTNLKSCKTTVSVTVSLKEMFLRLKIIFGFLKYFLVGILV